MSHAIPNGVGYLPQYFKTLLIKILQIWVLSVEHSTSFEGEFLSCCLVSIILQYSTQALWEKCQKYCYHVL